MDTVYKRGDSGAGRVNFCRSGRKHEVIVMEDKIRMCGIYKEFPGVKALQDVSLNLLSGEVLILLGENGAGKSTLMKILAGVHQPDQGAIFYRGQRVDIQSTKEAEQCGIYMIYQELNLVPDLSVAENLFLGREPRKKGGFVDFKEMYRQTTEILEELSLKIAPKTLVKDLSVAQSQMVEISRALLVKAEVIIMDEPTAAITSQETEQLFKQIRRLTKEGVSILYISHRLQEVLEIGDRIFVMRDGRYVDTVLARETNKDELIRLMVGRELGDLFPKEIYPKGDELLRAEQISNDKVTNVSFQVAAGEVLGFAGLMGAGRTELMRCLVGADGKEQGKIYRRGREVAIRTPRDAVKNAIAFITEDRKLTGIIAGMPIDLNITLASLERFHQHYFINHQKEETCAGQYIQELNVKTPGPNTDIAALSGGNQQKVILARWLATDAEIIIMDEPTRGIDVGAKREIYMLINELTKRGKGVILVSSDLPEILGMSDRIAVMANGRITGILKREEADQVTVMQLATKDVVL